MAQVHPPKSHVPWEPPILRRRLAADVGRYGPHFYEDVDYRGFLVTKRSLI